MLGLENILTLFFAYLVFGIKPGPYMMAFVSLAAKGHIKSLVSFWLGTAVSIFILYSLVLYSLDYFSNYIVNMSVPILLMKLITAIIFINLGLSGLQKLNVDGDAEEGAKRAKTISLADAVQNFGSGFLLTLSNPYHLFFVFSIIPALLETIKFSLAEIAYINLISIVADFCIISVFCLPILLLRAKMSEKVLKKIKQAANVIMILVGLYVLYSIFNQWDLIQSGILRSNFFQGNNL